MLIDGSKRRLVVDRIVASSFKLQDIIDDLSILEMFAQL